MGIRTNLDGYQKQTSSRQRSRRREVPPPPWRFTVAQAAPDHDDLLVAGDNGAGFFHGGCTGDDSLDQAPVWILAATTNAFFCPISTHASIRSHAAYPVHVRRSRNADVAVLIQSFEGGELPPNYRGFFACSNRRWFYEAHEVLEDFWLANRHGASGNFYKGLIQLAGAFVHLQKDRLRPSAALFKLARTNLEKYPGIHERLNLVEVLAMVADWQQQLEQGRFVLNPLTTHAAPELKTQTRPSGGL